MLAILLFTLAADPLPTPKFAPLPVPKFDGVTVTESGGEWVVKLNGRTFSVNKAESKETAVRLAKEIAGEKPAPTKAAVYQDRKDWHRHKCEGCGSIWEHPDATNSAGHYCPGCGLYENDKYKGGDAPVTIEKKPAAPAKPKRISLNGRWYDQYPDGRLVECVT